MYKKFLVFLVIIKSYFIFGELGFLVKDMKCFQESIGHFFLEHQICLRISFFWQKIRFFKRAKRFFFTQIVHFGGTNNRNFFLFWLKHFSAEDLFA